ncbi:MAG TPA: hypothetical protein VHP37_33415 [Burkholderiales bacterium]|nr:hypothetical protein [Burkholderiales bacterium]
MSHLPALTIADIPWLRLAARTAGVMDMPPATAAKLLKGGFVAATGKGPVLKITRRGELALDRLT